jgi:two-component system chemotaxis sensor kinase CheA
MNMQDTEFFKELISMFRIESDEHIKTMSEGLVQLRKNISKDKKTELYEEVFRAAHSLKGAARTVGLTDIEPIGFSFEKLFVTMKQKQIAITYDLYQILQQAIKSLDSLIKTMNDKGNLEGDRSDVVRLLEDAGHQLSAIQNNLC